MKIRKKLLKILVLFILAGSVANAEYLKENGEIYYKFPGYEIKLKVKDADFGSFESFGENMFEKIYYGKDRRNVYFFGKKLKDVSVNEFEILKENYVKDDKNLYEIKFDEMSLLLGNKINTKKILVDGLDVKSFKKLKSDYDVNYYADKNNIYYFDDNLKKIKRADKNSFEILENYTVAKDKNNVYYKENKLENVDSDSFEYFGDLIAKDKNRVFYINENKDIEGIDVKSFERAGESLYFSDKNSVFVNEPNLKKLGNIDRNSFAVLNKEIGKDKNGVYYLGIKMDGVNSDNVKIVENLKDKDYVIQSGNDDYLVFAKNDEDDKENKDLKIQVKKISNLNIDFDTFGYFWNFNYYRDKNSFYYYSGNDLVKIKSDIDAKSAENIESLNNFVKDKNNIYYFSDGKIKKVNIIIDVNNLEILEDSTSSYSSHIKDTKNVYFVDNENGAVKALKNADSKTFRVVGKNYGIDRKNVYYDGEKLDFVGVDGLEIFDENYLKDNKNVYEIYTADDGKAKARAIKNLNIDVPSFENILKGAFYKDKNAVYYADISWDKKELKKLEGADADTFEPGIISKDKNYVYIENQKLEGISSKGFEVLTDRMDVIKDYKNIYFLDRTDDGVTFRPKVVNIHGADIASFESVGDPFFGMQGYFKDKNNVYFIIMIDNGIEIRKINGANLRTFEVFNGYAKDDKNNVYYDGEKIEGIDIGSVEGINWLWIKDKNSVFYKGKKLKRITSVNFYYFDGGLSYLTILKDKNGVYKFLEKEDENNKKIIEIIPLGSKGIDLETIERIDSPMDSSDYFKDKNGVYFMDGEKFIKINDADKDSFRVTMGGKYGKDKNNVYFQEKKLEGENPIEFDE